MDGVSLAGQSARRGWFAGALGVPLIELDAVHHLPGWEPIDPARFVDVVRELTAGRPTDPIGTRHACL